MLPNGSAISTLPGAKRSAASRDIAPKRCPTEGQMTRPTELQPGHGKGRIREMSCCWLFFPFLRRKKKVLSSHHPRARTMTKGEWIWTPIGRAWRDWTSQLQGSGEGDEKSCGSTCTPS